MRSGPDGPVTGMMRRWIQSMWHPQRAWWKGFIRGFLAPSPQAVAGAVAVALLWMGGACLGIDESLLLRSGGRGMMRDARDESAWISAQVLRPPATSNAPSGPPAQRLCLVGASDLREALIEPADLAALASEKLGRPTEVVDLLMNMLLWEERAALLERVGADFDGYIVLSVGPQQMSRNTDSLQRLALQPRLGFQSDIFDEECRRAGILRPRPTRVYFLDNALFVLRRAVQLLPGANIPERRQFYEFTVRGDHQAVPDPAYARLSCFEPAAFARTRGVATRLIHRLQNSGKAKIVLLEVPWLDSVLDSEKSRERSDQKAAYVTAIRQLAQETGVRYLDLSDNVRWTADDFADYRHIGRAAARRRFSTALLEALGSPNP